jgi:hypothetical protein
MGTSSLSMTASAVIVVVVGWASTVDCCLSSGEETFSGVLVGANVVAAAAVAGLVADEPLLDDVVEPPDLVGIRSFPFGGGEETCLIPPKVVVLPTAGLGVGTDDVGAAEGILL